MLVNAGFELEAVYGDMSFDEPKADEQRLVFVARMKIQSIRNVNGRIIWIKL